MLRGRMDCLTRLLGVAFGETTNCDSTEGYPAAISASDDDRHRILLLGNHGQGLYEPRTWFSPSRSIDPPMVGPSAVLHYGYFMPLFGV
jgi:hypothetical protein